jgi:hypothetical protein
MTKMAMTKRALMRPDRDMSTPENYTTLAFPEERGESVRATPTCAATRESAGRKAKPLRSRDAVGIRGMGQAARKRHEASAFERSRREAGGGVRPFIPIQARKAKKETRKKEKRKKEGGTPADA